MGDVAFILMMLLPPLVLGAVGGSLFPRHPVLVGLGITVILVLALWLLSGGTTEEKTPFAIILSILVLPAAIGAAVVGSVLRLSASKEN